MQKIYIFRSSRLFMCALCIHSLLIVICLSPNRSQQFVSQPKFKQMKRQMKWRSELCLSIICQCAFFDLSFNWWPYITSRLFMIYVTLNDWKLNNIGKYFIQFYLCRSIQIFSYRAIELMCWQNMKFHLIQIVIDVPPYFVCHWFGQFVSSLVWI